MEHIKYEKIERLKKENKDIFTIDEVIVIEEKIDGANASFQYDAETDSMIAFSRNQKLDIKNNLRGFYQWVQELNTSFYKEFAPNDRFFGEWLVPHKVVYPQECYNNFYLFDIMNVMPDSNNFRTRDYVRHSANIFNLKTPALMYVGDFQGWEHCETFVGKTYLGGEFGEGVVVKLNKPTENSQHIKLISDKFSEVKRQKKTNNISEETLRLLAEYDVFITQNRIEKLIHKLIDNHLLDENWNEQDLNFLIQVLQPMMFKDILLEEKEINFNLTLLNKSINKKIVSYIKRILLNR